MIYAKVSKIRKALGELKIEKSGQNKYAGFSYYELSDILPHINRLNAEHGVCDVITINKETCTLTLHDTEKDEKIVFEVPYAEAEMLGKAGAKSSVDAIQRAGATITYQRRYLYMTAYNIVDSDMVDVPGNQTTVSKEENENKKKQIVKRLKDKYGDAHKDIIESALIQTGYMSIDEVDFNEINIKDFFDIIMKYIKEYESSEQNETIEVVNENQEGLF